MRSRAPGHECCSQQPMHQQPGSVRLQGTWGSVYLQFSGLYPLISGSNPLNCRYLGLQGTTRSPLHWDLFGCLQARTLSRVTGLCHEIFADAVDTLHKVQGSCPSCQKCAQPDVGSFWCCQLASSVVFLRNSRTRATIPSTVEETRLPILRPHYFASLPLLCRSKC